MSNARTRFIAEIESFMSKHGLEATTFGKMCLNDTAFLHKLREGRNPRLDTVEEVRAWMADYKARKQARPKSRPLAGAAA